MSRIKSKFIEINPQSCTACWRCVDNCPTKSLGQAKFLWHKHVKFSNSGTCIGCGKCITTCPNNVFNKIN